MKMDEKINEGMAYGIQLEIRSLEYKLNQLPKFLCPDSFVEQSYKDEVADCKSSYEFQIEELS